MLRYIYIGWLAACLLMASPVSLAQVGNAEPQAASVSLNMRDADIRSVVHWLSQTTGKRFVLDPRVQGTMTILTSGPVTPEDAYKVVLEGLRVYGFATQEKDGTVTVVPDARAKSMAVDLQELLDPEGPPTLAMYVVPLANVPAQDLVQQLKPLVPASGYISAASPTTMLLVDALDNVKRLARLAEHIDSQDNSGEIEVIALETAPAQSVAQILSTLFPNQKGFSVAADERSNSVLVAGLPSLRNQARQLAIMLDNPQTALANTRVFYLHYLEASELLPVLKGITAGIQKDEEGKTSSSGIVSIEAVEAINAIVVNAPPRYIDEIASVIEKTDFRRAQVLVDAIIVEVNDDFAQELGVQWSTSFGADASGVEGATNFGLANFDADGNFILGQGLTLGLVRGGSIRAIVNAVASNVDANLLSRPSLITLDNQEAKILVGQNIPLITGQSTGSASPTDNPFTTVERKDIGITLNVTPHVNEGDAITLDVIQEVETVNPQASTEVTTDLVTTKRSIETKVLVGDQDILVLGGLIDTVEQKTINKVPVLGDIPLLGALFRSTKVEQQRRNLMVFIRPTIVNEEAMADKVTRERYEAVRKSQQDYYKRDKKEKQEVVLPAL